MTETAAPSAHKDWWLRAGLVLQAPRAVFSALRDEDEDDRAARAEPVLAIMILAGIAAVLSSSAAAHLLDDGAYDGLLVAVWAFLGGSIYGGLLYWGGGLLLHFAVLSLGSRADYRRSRQLLAFSAMPLAVSLVLWLPRLALYGGDSFRYAGSDRGTGSAVFGWLEVAFTAWALGLLALGVRTTERWSWQRSAAAVAAAGFIPALIVFAVYGVV